MAIADYHFEAVTVTNYKCNIKTTLNNRAIKLLQKKLNKIKRLRELNKIIIPENCYNYIIITLMATINDIEKDINKDGIYMLSKEVKEAFFIKENLTWSLNVELKGLYNERD